MAFGWLDGNGQVEVGKKQTSRKRDKSMFTVWGAQEENEDNFV